MTKYACIFGLSFLLVSAAQAQNNRSAVSLDGSDSASCTVPDPCRTFGVAMSRTNAGGEIIVLGSGGYGPFTVTKSVSIISPLAFHAAMAPTAGSAITVNTPAGAVVVLRGLYLNSLGGVEGISIESPSIVHIENIVINGFSGSSLRVIGSLGANVAEVFVKDSTIRNGGASAIFAGPASGSVIMAVDSTRLESNVWGIVADSGVSLSVRNTVATRNTNVSFWLRNGGANSRLSATIENSLASDSTYGFLADDGADVTVRNSTATRHSFAGFDARSNVSGTTSELAITECVASKNSFGGMVAGEGGAGTGLVTVSNSTVTSNTSVGIISQTSGVVRAFGNTVTRNGTGFVQSGGTFDSAGHNMVKGNTAETSGTINQVPTM